MRPIRPDNSSSGRYDGPFGGPRLGSAVPRQPPPRPIMQSSFAPTEYYHADPSEAEAMRREYEGYAARQLAAQQADDSEYNRRVGEVSPEFMARYGRGPTDDYLSAMGINRPVRPEIKSKSFEDYFEGVKFTPEGRLMKKNPMFGMGSSSVVGYRPQPPAPPIFRPLSSANPIFRR
jgi:hypothetical protein